MKTSGAVLKKFLADNSFWAPSPTENWCFDDAFFDVKDGAGHRNMDSVYSQYGDNLERLPDDAEVVIQSGYIVWQGTGKQPRPEQSFDDALKQWVAAQSVRTVVATLEIPVDVDTVTLQHLVEQLKKLGAVKVSGLPEGEPPAPRGPKP